MYTLYYTTRSFTSESTSLIPRIALEELGLNYKVIEVELEPTAPDWYRALNPHGKIPTLTRAAAGDEEELVIFPSAAILLHLADADPDNTLVPATAAERSLCYRHMFDMAEMLQNAFMMSFFSDHFSTDEADEPAVRQKAFERLNLYFQRMDETLRAGPYLVGGQYTICDIYQYVMMRWYQDIYGRDGKAVLRPLTDFENVMKACALIEQRPAVQRSLTADDIDFISPLLADLHVQRYKEL